MNNIYVRHYIYITDDKKIVPGDWCVDTQINFIFKLKERGHSGLLRSETDSFVEDSCKRIILTTAPKLIEDGIQAIDGEFLEWFAKNPSCDEVKIEDYGNLYNFRYLILVPREEVDEYSPNYNMKKEILEEMEKQPKCTCVEHDPYCCKIHGSCPTCVKQETLEEAEVAFANEIQQISDYDKGRWYGRIEGANWLMQVC
jgi:hypothetical protein